MNRLLTQVSFRPACAGPMRTATTALRTASHTRHIYTSHKRSQASVSPVSSTSTTTTPHRAPPTPVQSLGKTRTGRTLPIRTYPRNTPQEERQYRKEHLAAAFRIFADRGYDEGVAGHISVRDPILTDHFWLNPLSTHFSQLRVSDLVLVDDAGFVVDGAAEPINTAAFAIHSAIHAARPDVHAACHAHSVHGKAFSCFGRELDMLTQDALRFYKSHAVYPRFGGVVVDAAEGARIAAALGAGKAVILQNHGLLTVGASVDEAAFWFMSLDRTCHAQLLADAAAAGSGYEKKVIDPAECEHSSKSVGGSEKGWLAFQPYYDEMLARTGGDFLQ